MNLNLSNVSANSKTSLTESGTKVPTQESESKGFFNTLAGVFSGSQKEQTQSIKSKTEVSGNDESQETTQNGTDIEITVGQDVTHSMDEGQQLLGRIEQANQTLSAHGQEAESGKSLPPEPLEWQADAFLGSQTATMLNEKGSADLVQRISVDELEVIDTKLAQGKPLTEQEAEIIEGLRTGTAIAELAEGDLAQLVALPSDVKLALSETQMIHSNALRQVVTSATTSQVTPQELKHAAVQVPTNTEGSTTAGVNPVVEQMAANTEVSHKALNAALAAGTLKATVDKQDNGEPQHGLAGQLQAAASQQGITTPQQAKVDAAQQAQLPLQLTKELANDQVAEKVQMMMSKNLKNLDIRLDPPELGRMQIRMTMNSDLANVHFTVTNPQARDIIEQTLPRLREMLAQQGMQLVDASVQQQSRGEQQGGYTAGQRDHQGSDSRGLSGQIDDGLESGPGVEMNVSVTSQNDGISYYA